VRLEFELFVVATVFPPPFESLSPLPLESLFPGRGDEIDGEKEGGGWGEGKQRERERRERERAREQERERDRERRDRRRYMILSIPVCAILS